MTNPNTHETRRAMEQLDLVIVQDLFLNETAREFGDVFLPAASSFEKDGTFMNGERRVQRVRGACRADWRSPQRLGDHLRRCPRHGQGKQFAYGSAEEIWDEVRSLWPEGAGHQLRPARPAGRPAVALL